MTQADLEALLLPLAARIQDQSRLSANYAVLAEQNSVPLLLRAGCLQMEPAAAELAVTLRAELGVSIGADLREAMLGTASLMSALTAQFRRETCVGCVDRAVQKIVGTFTLGADLSSVQWRIASRSVRTADHAIGIVALDILDLLHTRFGFPRGNETGPGKLSATERYHLILGLPQAAHRGHPVSENIYAPAGMVIFQRLADEL